MQDFTLLASNPTNIQHLRAIHSSAFVVSLDDSYPPPDRAVDVSRALWHGLIDVGPSNVFVSPTSAHMSFQSTPNPTPPRIARALGSRFVDKPIQFVVFDNSVAGLMAEHSVMDGTSTARMCDDVLTWLTDPNSELELSAPYPALLVSEPKPLDFDLSKTSALQASIASAEKRLYTLASEQALSFVRTKYGKRAIKTFGVGPDGWAQLVIQLAYARLAECEAPNGKMTEWPVCTYEAATTRRFYKGRLEAIRVVTNEVVDWVHSMENASMNREEKADKFKKAVVRHREIAREAGMAEGVDRHMLGTYPPRLVFLSCSASLTIALRTRSETSQLFFHSSSGSLHRPVLCPRIPADAGYERGLQCQV